MLTADQIRDELIRQLDERKLTGRAVASTLCIAPARVTEMKNRGRKVQQAEMGPLAEYLKMVEPDPTRRDPVESVAQIPNLGRVAQGVWLEESEADGTTVAYDRMRGDPPPTDLFAVTPVGTSMNLRFMPGTHLICRRVPFGIGGFRAGDYVIVKRHAHELHEMTCKRVEIDDEGVYWLYSESSDPKFAEPWRAGKPDEAHHDDMEISAVGKVIRAVQDFEGGLH